MGSQNSTSTSTPLTAAQRQETYDAGMKNMSSSLPTAGYSEPTYQEAAPARTLTGGDYNKLQSDLYTGYTTGLDYDKAKSMSAINDSLAKRGVWSSGAGVQSEIDNNNAYAGAYAKAGADATAQRYTLQNAEDNATNTYNLQTTAAKNAFETEQAKQKYEASWRPADYKAGVWNGTGGTISSGTSGGWSI